MLIEVTKGTYVNPIHVTRISYAERVNDGKYNLGIRVLGEQANINLILNSLDEVSELISRIGSYSN